MASMTISMGIDVPSSFRSMRQLTLKSAKRQRSPDASDNVAEHPSKRVTLALGDTEYNYHPVFSGHEGFNSVSTNSSRAPSEDFVQRTGGLSIDSPVPSGSIPFGLQQPQECAEIASPDVDMAVDPYLQDGASSHLHSQQKPHLPALQTSNAYLGQAVIQSGSVFSGDNPPLSYARARMQYVPDLNVTPPTPVSASDQPPALQLDITQGPNLNTPETDIVPMAISPTLPPSQLASSRRKRLTMGPRADCEKCQRGMKGHWMHLD